MSRSRIRSAPDVCLFLALLAGQCAGRGYYMDAAMPDNSGNAASPSSAWRDFKPFVGKVVAPGDTLYLRRGRTWAGQILYIYHGGAAGNPFVVTSYGDASDPLPRIVDSSPEIVGVGASHVVVQQLDLGGGYAACLANVEPHLTDLTVQDMVVHDCDAGISISTIDTAVIQRNDVHHMYFANGSSGAVGIALDSTTHVKVLENIVRDCWDSTATGNDGGAFELFRANSDIEIAWNRAYRTDGFLEMGGLRGDTIRRVVVHHNIALETNVLLWLNARTPTDTSDQWGVGYSDVYFDNNTLVQRARKAASSIGVNTTLTSSNQVYVRNNLVDGDSSVGFTYDGPFDHSHNLFWSKLYELPAHPSAAVGEFWADPLLTEDDSNVIYDLLPASLAIDSGLRLAYPSYMELATLPVLSGFPSIGAIEYHLQSPSLFQVAEKAWSVRVVGGMVRVGGWIGQSSPYSAVLRDILGRILARWNGNFNAGPIQLQWGLPTGIHGGMLRVQAGGQTQDLILPPI